MKNILLSILLLTLTSPVIAQFCTNDHRFTEREFFTEAQIDSSKGVRYGEALNARGDTITLEMDFYYPSLSADTLSARPFILLAHGGGFIAGDRTLMRDKCFEFAQRGFVAATMGYRLNFPPNLDARYMAIQDGHAAFRYAVHHANTYRIDTAWVFAGGRSAGSILVMGIVFLDQADWNALDNQLVSNFGTVNTSGNTLTDAFSIKGIFNNWGNTYSSGMAPTDLVPMISFHGGVDPLVDIDQSVDASGDTLIGSQSIHNACVSNGICSELNIDSLGGHGIYDNPTGAVFRVERATCFFKSVFCNSCNTASTFDSIPANCATPTSRQTAAPGNNVSVYPNPMVSMLHVKGLEAGAIVVLYNAMGQAVRESGGQSPLPVSDLAPGVYLLEVRSGDTRQVFRVLKSGTW